MNKLYLYVIDIKRNDKGSIDSVNLSDGNSADWVEKRKIKEQLYIGAWEIDRLYLSKDNKLLERVKDTKISDYEDSCHKLGLEPFKIEKMGNDYVVIDFPRNLKQTIIPDFITGVSMDKRIINKNAEINYQNVINQKVNLKTESDNKFNTEIYSLLKKTNKDLSGLSTDLDKQLKDLFAELREFKEESLDADERVNKQLEDIDRYLEEIKNKDISADLLPHLESLKEVISENGRTIFELKDSVSETMNNFTTSFNEKMDVLNTKPSDANNKSLLPKYLRSDDKLFSYSNRENYDMLVNNGFHDLKVEKINLIPFDYLESLKPIIEYYYNMYTVMDEVFVNINEKQLNELVKFKNGLTLTNETIDVVGNIPLIGSSAKWAKSTSIFISDTRTYNRYVKKLSKIYSEPQELLDDFYGDTDADILKFLIEYRVLSKSTEDGIHAKKDKTVLKFRVKSRLDYYRLIQLIFVNMNDNLEYKFTEEVIKRLAISYIIAEKILNNEFNDLIPYKINPNYGLNANELNITSRYFIGEDSIKYKAFLYSILLHFMYSILLIQGFDIRFVDKIFNKFCRLEKDFTVIRIENVNGLGHNLDFNFNDYKEKIEIKNFDYNKYNPDIHDSNYNLGFF